MTVDNIEIIIYTMQFVIPGYIISEVISTIMPSKRISDSERLIQTIGYSIVNMGIWYWLFALLSRNCSSAKPCYWLINALLLIITGGVTGIVLGVLRAKNIVRKLFEHWHISIQHPVPTAWDYKFSSAQSCWIEVFLTNGKVLRGLYSLQSFASSDESYRDIFIEQLHVQENGNWYKVEQTDGVWINPNEIRYIKFYGLEGDNCEQ